MWILEELEDRVGVLAVDIDLRAQREGHAVVDAAELLDVGIIAGLLVGELPTWEPEHDETLRAIRLVKFLQPVVLRGESALAGGVHDQEGLPAELVQVDGFAGVGGEGEVVDGIHRYIVHNLIGHSQIETCHKRV